ncbi:prepilin-type N-terminal cleavage/methylation domain-containing protein [Ureibacillus chungkukjangi]
MFKTMKKRIKNEKGLTLIELLAVVVILAIIAAIAIPAIGNIVSKQRDKAVLSDATSIISAAKIAYADGACVDDSCSGAELNTYLDAKLKNKTSIIAAYNNSTGLWSLTWDSDHDFKRITGVDALEAGTAAVPEETILAAMNS